MRFHDPLRQLGANGVPKYEGLVETLPSWQLRPDAEPGWAEVVVWLPRGANRYGYGTLRVRVWELPEELEAYRDDPEGWLERKMGWRRGEATMAASSASSAKPSLPKAPVVSSSSSSEDLGF